MQAQPTPHSSLHLVLQARLVGTSKLPACLPGLPAERYRQRHAGSGRQAQPDSLCAGCHGSGYFPADLPSSPILLDILCLHAAVCFTAGTYIDKKCPFTGDVSIRGRILSGLVRSTKMHRTIIIRRNYVHYIKKYAR